MPSVRAHCSASASHAVPRLPGASSAACHCHSAAQVEKEAYWVSKVQAERAAWEVARQQGLDLVTILPGAGLRLRG